MSEVIPTHHDTSDDRFLVSLIEGADDGERRFLVIADTYDDGSQITLEPAEALGVLSKMEALRTYLFMASGQDKSRGSDPVYVPRHVAQREQPYTCPVCRGSGKVPYVPFSVSATTVGLTTGCHPCKGKGILWR